jgi:cytochrome c biogenesis factor
MAKEFLGDFEELILTIVAADHENAYGAAINIEIEQWLGRKVTLSAVHVLFIVLKIKDLSNRKSEVRPMNVVEDAKEYTQLLVQAFQY